MEAATVLLKIIGDSSDAEGTLDSLTRGLRRFGAQKATATADVNTAPAQGKLARFGAALTALSARKVNVGVDANTTGATAKVGLFGRALALLAPEADRSSGALHRLSAAAAGAGGAAGGALRVGIGPLSGALSPMTVLVGAATAAIGTAFVAALTSMAASAAMAAAGLGALAVGGFGALLAAGPLVAGVLMRFKEQADIAGTSANLLKGALEQMKGAFNSAVSPGAANLMRGLADAVRALVPLVGSLRPQFTGLGEDIARGMRLAANDVAGLRGKIQTLVSSSGGLFRNLARSVGPLSEVLLNIANAALPHLTRAAGDLVDVFKGWAEGTNNAKKMDRVIGGLVDHLRSWVDLASSVADAMAAVVLAIAPLGKALVDDLADSAAQFAKWARSAKGTKKIRDVFTTLVDVARDVVSVVGKIVVGFVELAKAAAPITSQLVSGFADLARTVGSALQDPLRRVGELIRDFVEAARPAVPFFENVLGPILKGVFDGVMLALQPLVWAVRLFADALGWLGEKAAPLRPILEKIGLILGVLFAGPLLSTAGTLLRGIGGGFGVLGRAAQLAGGVLSWAGGVMRDLIGRVVPGLSGALTRGVGSVRTAAGGLRTAVREGLGSLAQRARNVAGGLVTGLSDALGAGVGKAREGGRKVRRAVQRGLGTLVAHGKSVANGLVTGIAAALGASVGKLKDAGKKTKDALKRGTEGMEAEGGRKGKGFVSRMIEQLKGQAGRLKTAGVFIVGVLVSVLGPKKFVTAGKFIGQGLINGLRSMGGKIAKAGRDVASWAYNAAKRFLDARSPSRLFEDLGRNVGQGFANGITAMGSTVGKAIDRTMTGQVNAVGANLSAAVTASVAIPSGLRAPAPAAAAGPNGGVTFNHDGDVILRDSADEDRLVRKQLWQLRKAGLAP